MKRWVIFALVLLVVLAAIIVGERRKAEAPVKPDPLVYFVADTQHELTRLPVAATRLSDAEEIKIGDEMARFYIGMRRGQSDEEKAQARVIEEYIHQVGSRVAAYAHRKLPYRFHYIPDSNFINAFALPGGHVFIGSGLLSFMDSEDELASVLGHEVEHIDHYHCAERAQVQARTRKIPLGGLVALPIQIFTAGYSKDEELEADREGTKLAVWASYSPLGAIRMFETFDRLYSEHVTRAASPQEELSQVAEQAIQDYFRSHPAAGERIAQIRGMMAAEHWEARTQERDLRVAYFFWTGRARQACASGRYDRCAGLALRSLTLNPDQPQALEVLARAQFLLADFESAAATYRKYLDQYTFDVELMRAYADALGARGNPSAGAQQFDELINKQFSAMPLPILKVELAGLELLAGKEVLASEFSQQESLDPSVMGRLGWWYYRAGRYNQAATLLNRAVERRPGVETLITKLGWALIEQHNYESALERFYQALGGRQINSSLPLPGKAARPFDNASMGVAIALWQANQKAEAMKWFSSATLNRPQWLNARWVGALYAPSVARSVAEMQAEGQKRAASRPVPSLTSPNSNP